jgi:hypothetical protein
MSILILILVTWKTSHPKYASKPDGHEQSRSIDKIGR